VSVGERIQSDETSIAYLDNARLRKFPRTELRDVQCAPRSLTTNKPTLRTREFELGLVSGRGARGSAQSSSRGRGESRVVALAFVTEYR